MRKETKKRIRYAGQLLFLLYMFLLIYFLFFSESFGRTIATEIRYRYNLVPFVEIRRFWKYRETVGDFLFVSNIFGNIIGFLPFGMILPVILPKMNHGFQVIGSGMFLSLTVEILQLVSGVGCFDVDDVLLNTFGTILGYLVFRILNCIRRKHYG